MNAIVPFHSLRTFSFDGKDLRIVERAGEPWFVATDVCAGLKLKDVSDAVAKLDEDEKGRASIPTPGGAQEMLVISEAGLYTLILRCRGATIAGTASHRFRRYVTGDVLPSIRKTGTYAPAGSQPVTAPNLIALLGDPEQVLALVAHHAQATIAARAETEAERQAHTETHQQLEDTSRVLYRTDRALVVAREELAEQAPDVAAMRRFRDTGRSENLRTLPRILDAGEREVFAWMKERGFLFKQGGWLQPRADLRKRRDPIFVVRQVECEDQKIRWQTMVTPTGQIWLHQRWEARKLILARKAAQEAAERAADEEAERLAAEEKLLFD